RELDRDEQKAAEGQVAADGGEPRGDGGKAVPDGPAVKPDVGEPKGESAGSTGPDSATGGAEGTGDDTGDGGDDGGAKKAAPKTSALESSKCKKTRQDAKDALGRRAWSDVLSGVRSRTCWKGKYRGEYANMKIKALFETKQFAKCAKLDKDARYGSAGTQNLVKSCKTRAAMGG
ncbi:MAG: hypothetical protein KDK70_23475, partial [Myxococcales bacterium]|nr:hypothetical protein [Myxococcales bacterium]